MRRTLAERRKLRREFITVPVPPGEVTVKLGRLDGTVVQVAPEFESVRAAREAGLDDNRFMACERGASFGYNNLVSDMRSLAILRETGAPVVFDATHSVQLPGGQGTSSGGQREMVPVLARAAVAVGVAGLFMETHPDPAHAMSDGPNAVPLKHMRALLQSLVELDRVVKAGPLLEQQILG